MIRLLILAALGFAVGLFILKLLSKKQDDDVIEGDVVDEKANQDGQVFSPFCCWERC